MWILVRQMESKLITNTLPTALSYIDATSSIQTQLNNTTSGSLSAVNLIDSNRITWSNSTGGTTSSISTSTIIFCKFSNARKCGSYKFK